MKNSLLNFSHFVDSKSLETARTTKDGEFIIEPGAIAKFFLSIILLLTIAHAIAIYLIFNFPDSNRVVSLMDKYFNFNNESNFPSFISAVNLLIAAGLLFFIASFSVTEKLKKNKNFWRLLGCIFLFLCFDEATQIHEELVLTVRNRMPNLSGIFYYAWVIPYSVLFLGVVVYFMRFVLALPAKTRNLFFISGFLFVFGAIGCELVEGYIEKFYGRNLIYNLFTTVEEFLEMVSIVIFIYALLDYITLYKSKFTLIFKHKS
jgi:hypothetical protein